MVLGGSGAVVSGVKSRVTVVITHIRELITILITTHEPPSNLPSSTSKNSASESPDLTVQGFRGFRGFGVSGFRV